MGRVGNGNLGDEALVAAVVAGVRRHYPDARIYGITLDPEDTVRRHGIVAYPIERSARRGMAGGQTPAPSGDRSSAREFPPRWVAAVPPLHWLARAVRAAWRRVAILPAEVRFLRRSYAFARGTDLLVVAGSQQLNDHWDGPWRHPFVLLKWSLLARVAGIPVAFLSMGAGPLYSRLGMWFVKLSLSLARYRSVRDEDSRTCLRAAGVAPQPPLVPDLAFGLRVQRPTTPVRPDGARRVIGINAMPAFDPARWPEHDGRVYDTYVRTLAAFADWLMVRGYRIAFFSTQLRTDPDVAREIRSLMTSSEPPGTAVPPIRSLEDLMEVLSTLDAVVTTRYHGALLALLLGKPVVALSYHPKTQALMELVGLSRNVVDLHGLDVEQLIARFVALEQDGWRLPDAVAERISAARAAVEAQYDQVFQTVEP
jgi:polysaccharide pyruvyl transferase WcaK-like protein